MSKVIFENLVDPSGKQLEIDLPNDKAIAFGKRVKAASGDDKASASGKRLKSIMSNEIAKEKMHKVLSILDNVNEKLDELEINHKRDQAIKDANLLIDRVEEILICWFSDNYEKSFKFNDSQKKDKGAV